MKFYLKAENYYVIISRKKEEYNMEIVGKSSNNRKIEIEELDISDEDIEIEELDEYSKRIKQQILSESLITYTDSFNDCPYKLIQYIKVCSKITEMIPIYVTYNRVLISCFLASLLFENNTTNYFKNHGINFIECMKKLGKNESNILEYEQGLKIKDFESMKGIWVYLEGICESTITESTINDIVYTILDSKKTKDYCIENLIYSVNPDIEIGDSILSTIREYNRNYIKELHEKKYNELFGNVPENIIKCIKYAYEVYCELNSKIGKLSKRQEKLSLIVAIIQKGEIDISMLMNYLESENGRKINMRSYNEPREKLSINDLNKISSMYAKYLKSENGITLELSDILNNLMHELNMDKEYDEYKIKVEENLKKQEMEKIQGTLDKISKYEFSDYIITSYKIFKTLNPKWFPEKDNLRNYNIRFAYSLFLGIYCCKNNNLIEEYLCENKITIFEATKIFGLNLERYVEYQTNNTLDEEIESDIYDFWNSIDEGILIVNKTYAIIRCDKDMKSIEDFFLKAEEIVKPITDYFNLSWQDLKMYIKLKRFANIKVLPPNLDNTISIANYGNDLMPLVKEINKVLQDSIKIDIDVEQVNTILCTLEFNKRKNFFRWLIREKTPTITKEIIDNISNVFNKQLSVFEEEVNVSSYLKKLIAIYILKLEECIKVLEEEIKSCEILSRRDKKTTSGKMFADDALAKKEQLEFKIRDFNIGISAMLDNYKKTSQAEKLAGIYMSRINICINTIVPSLYNNLLLSNFLVKQQEVSTAISFIDEMLNGMVNLNNKGLIESLNSINDDESFSGLVPAIPEQLRLELESNSLIEGSESESKKLIRHS